MHLPKTTKPISQPFLVPVLLITILYFPTLLFAQSNASYARELKFDRSIERTITKGSTDDYRLPLQRGQALFVDLREQTYDVTVELIKTPDKSVARVNLGAGWERENLIFAAEDAGEYLLRIHASENQFGNGEYRFSARLADSLTDEDRTRTEALRSMDEAVLSQKENTAVKIREAIGLRERALALWEKLGDKYWEGRTLDRLGTAHNALQENNKAVEYLDRALQIVRDSGDKPLEAATLNTIGSMTNGFGENQQATGYHDQALQIFQKKKNNVGIMSSWHFLGNANSGRKDYVKATQYYQQSLSLAQKEGNKNFEASSQFLLGTVFEAQNEKEKATEKYALSLALWRDIKNNGGIALAQWKIGTVQSSQGKNEEAMKSLNEALPLFQSEKNRRMEVAVYNAIYGIQLGWGKGEEAIENVKKSLAYYQEFKIRMLEIGSGGLIAGLYNNYGNSAEAIRYSEMTLATEETVAERTSEELTKQFQDSMKTSKAMVMNTLGSVYFNADDTKKALFFFNKALTVFENRKDTNSKQLTQTTLGSIAQIHAYNYEWEQALDKYNRSLSIARDLDDKFEIAAILNTIGLIYDTAGERGKALENFEKASEIIGAVPEKTDTVKRFEASILDNVGSCYRILGRPKPALEFHGRALKIREEIKDIRFIDGQASTYQSIAHVYSLLGENDKAREVLSKSLNLFRQAPQQIKELARNRSMEGIILHNIGTLYRNRGDLRKAIEYYDQALKIAVDKKRLGLESSALNSMSLVNLAFGEPRKALQNLDQALEINLRIGDKSAKPSILNNIAQVYSYWGDQEKVLEYTNQALKIAEEIGDKDLAATCLSNLGSVYRELSENEKASEYLNRSLKISREIGSKSSEAVTLNNLAYLYSNTGERGKALDSYEQALSIVRGIGDKTSEATVFGNIAWDYAELGEYEKALENRGKALKLNREIGDKLGVIAQLLGLGGIYRKLGEQDKKPENFENALLHYEQALDLGRKTESKISEASALLGMGQVYIELNQSAKALPALTQALAYSKKFQNRYLEDVVHIALGKLHVKMGAVDKAIEEYAQALTVARAISDKDIEARALRGLMSAWRSGGKTPQAIFFGKQAVNKYQELRGSIGNLGRKTQDLYRDKVTDAYRELADLLIEAGRLPEAEKVLAMLKQQEAFDFIRRDSGEAGEMLLKRVFLDPREERSVSEYARLSDQLIAKSLAKFKLENKPNLSDAEKEELKRLTVEIDEANAGIKLFFEKLEGEFTKSIEDQGVITAGTIGSLQKDMRKAGPGVILVSTYLLPERYRAIISTGRATVDRKTEYKAVNLDAQKVNLKIRDFKQALQDPAVDPRPLGKELYDIFIKPIEKDIVAADARTILWSLDGNLRYIPVGALFDGKRYLAERYQNVIVTLAGGGVTSLFVEPNRGALRILGLGVSRKYGNFSELPGVPFELGAIVHDERGPDTGGGVLPGIRLLDSDFTDLSFAERLKPEASGKTFNIVHLATHFKLGNTGADSGLLLGNGELLSLTSIDKESRFDFIEVDLLTLSACETGVSIVKGDGGEVESLGLLVQQKGAKAVLASLWSVADESTAVLMSEFYRLRKENPRLTKAEAMQLVQKAMLEGRLQPITVEGRKGGLGPIKGIETIGAANRKLTAPAFPFDPGKPYAHPYFWSPFILIGNWR
jgi:tetratricopeptide (TPR) repeat protein